ncbi:hypothetical protein ACIBO2_56950 [Nonomuraea sp. NPDC050022]|uniref:hypothetical protein n=1 Tax=unclassified Nonomuraea TaxID=2593643 RepID=UPI0033F6C61B
MSVTDADSVTAAPSSNGQGAVARPVRVPGEGWRLVAALAIPQTTKASTPAALTMAQTAGYGW